MQVQQLPSGGEGRGAERLAPAPSCWAAGGGTVPASSSRCGVVWRVPCGALPPAQQHQRTAAHRARTTHTHMHVLRAGQQTRVVAWPMHACMRPCALCASIHGQARAQRPTHAPPPRVQDAQVMGADYYESDEQRAAALASGGVPVGIGAGSTISNAIVDKNARVGEQPCTHIARLHAVPSMCACALRQRQNDIPMGLSLVVSVSQRGAPLHRYAYAYAYAQESSVGVGGGNHLRLQFACAVGQPACGSSLASQPACKGRGGEH